MGKILLSFNESFLDDLHSITIVNIYQVKKRVIQSLYEKVDLKGKIQAAGKKEK